MDNNNLLKRCMYCKVQFKDNIELVAWHSDRTSG